MNDTKDLRIEELEAKVERLENALTEIKSLSAACAPVWQGHPAMDFITDVFVIAKKALEGKVAQS